jgi:glycosyltransferase involved in cell wall biosynthesis
MIRVLSVIHFPSFGGPHNQVLRLAGPLAERGFSTLVVIPDEPGNAFDRLHSAGIDIRRMPLGRVRARLDWRVQLASVRTLIGDVPRLARLIRDEEIDLVVVHGSLNLQAAVAARWCRRPVVVQVIDTRTPRPLRLATAPLLRALPSTVMTTGRSVADEHPGLPRDPSRLFPFFPPVDTRLFSPDEGERQRIRAGLGFDAGDVVIGCVANVTPQKDLRTYVAVADRLAAAYPRTRFALFGQRVDTHDDYAARVLSGARALIDDGRLVVKDVGPDVPEHVRALDVFLATAAPRSEGVSTTILEAMSCGVPVVSTDVGAIREALLHGTTGFLAPASDVAALAMYVGRLVKRPSEREAMGRAARARAVAEFDVERCADVHARAFWAALARRPRGAGES